MALTLVDKLTDIKKALFRTKVLVHAGRKETVKRCAATLRKLALEFPKHKKLLSKLTNSAQSVYEGLESNDAGPNDVLDFAREIRGAIDLVLAIEADEEEKRKKPPVAQDKNSLLKMVQESDPVIRKYSIYGDKIPLNLGVKPFMVTRLPVIPMCDPPLNFEKLRRLKLSTDRISFYPVLLDQVVLGLSTDWVKDEFEGKPLDAAEYVLDTLKKKTGKTRMVVGKTRRFKRKIWLWIPSDNELNKIRSTSMGGGLAIDEWGFPFQEG